MFKRIYQGLVYGQNPVSLEPSLPTNPRMVNPPGHSKQGFQISMNYDQSDPQARAEDREALLAAQPNVRSLGMGDEALESDASEDSRTPQPRRSFTQRSDVRANQHWTGGSISFQPRITSDMTYHRSSTMPGHYECYPPNSSTLGNSGHLPPPPSAPFGPPLPESAYQNTPHQIFNQSFQSQPRRVGNFEVTPLLPLPAFSTRGRDYPRTCGYLPYQKSDLGQAREAILDRRELSRLDNGVPHENEPTLNTDDVVETTNPQPIRKTPLRFTQEITVHAAHDHSGEIRQPESEQVEIVVSSSAGLVPTALSTTDDTKIPPTSKDTIMPTEMRTDVNEPAQQSELDAGTLLNQPPCETVPVEKSVKTPDELHPNETPDEIPGPRFDEPICESQPQAIEVVVSQGESSLAPQAVPIAKTTPAESTTAIKPMSESFAVSKNLSSSGLPAEISVETQPAQTEEGSLRDPLVGADVTHEKFCLECPAASLSEQIEKPSENAMVSCAASSGSPNVDGSAEISAEHPSASEPCVEKIASAAEDHLVSSAASSESLAAVDSVQINDKTSAEHPGASAMEPLIEENEIITETPIVSCAPPKRELIAPQKTADVTSKPPDVTSKPPSGPFEHLASPARSVVPKELHAEPCLEQPAKTNTEICATGIATVAEAGPTDELKPEHPASSDQICDVEVGIRPETNSELRVRVEDTPLSEPLCETSGGRFDEKDEMNLAERTVGSAETIILHNAPKVEEGPFVEEPSRASEQPRLEEITDPDEASDKSSSEQPSCEHCVIQIGSSAENSPEPHTADVDERLSIGRVAENKDEPSADPSSEGPPKKITETECETKCAPTGDDLDKALLVQALRSAEAIVEQLFVVSKTERSSEQVVEFTDESDGRVNSAAPARTERELDSAEGEPGASQNLASGAEPTIDETDASLDSTTESGDVNPRHISIGHKQRALGSAVEGPPEHVDPVYCEAQCAERVNDISSETPLKDDQSAAADGKFTCERAPEIQKDDRALENTRDAISIDAPPSDEGEELESSELSSDATEEQAIDNLPRCEAERFALTEAKSRTPQSEPNTLLEPTAEITDKGAPDTTENPPPEIHEELPPDQSIALAAFPALIHREPSRAHSEEVISINDEQPPVGNAGGDHLEPPASATCATHRVESVYDTSSEQSDKSEQPYAALDMKKPAEVAIENDIRADENARLDAGRESEQESEPSEPSLAASEEQATDDLPNRQTEQSAHSEVEPRTPGSNTTIILNPAPGGITDKTPVETATEETPAEIHEEPGPDQFVAPIESRPAERRPSVSEISEGLLAPSDQSTGLSELEKRNAKPEDPLLTDEGTDPVTNRQPSDQSDAESSSKNEREPRLMSGSELTVAQRAGLAEAKHIAKLERARGLKLSKPSREKSKPPHKTSEPPRETSAPPRAKSKQSRKVSAPPLEISAPPREINKPSHEISEASVEVASVEEPSGPAMIVPEEDSQAETVQITKSEMVSRRIYRSKQWTTRETTIESEILCSGAPPVEPPPVIVRYVQDPLLIERIDELESSLANQRNLNNRLKKQWAEERRRLLELYESRIYEIQSFMEIERRKYKETICEIKKGKLF